MNFFYKIGSSPFRLNYAM